MLSELESLQKKAREEFEDFTDWGFPQHIRITPEYKISTNSLEVFLETKIKEAYLAGARAYEEAVRLEYTEAFIEVLENWELSEPSGRDLEKLADKFEVPVSIAANQLFESQKEDIIQKLSALSALKEKSKKFYEEYEKG